MANRHLTVSVANSVKFSTNNLRAAKLKLQPGPLISSIKTIRHILLCFLVHFAKEKKNNIFTIVHFAPSNQLLSSVVSNNRAKATSTVYYVIRRISPITPPLSLERTRKRTRLSYCSISEKALTVPAEYGYNFLFRSFLPFVLCFFFLSS